MSIPARPAPDKEQFVASLARGLAVLRAFGPAGPELTLSEVAAATDLNPAVARRFLLTLVQLGYVK
jgi:IclR family pca regulon transcriptional regulator